VELAHEVEVSLLLSYEAPDPIMRTVAFAGLRAASQKALRYVQSPEEAKILNELHRNLDRYELQPIGSASSEQVFADALNSTHRLTEINIEEG